MKHYTQHIEQYLEFCKNQKRLDNKTVKAYRLDLQQFKKYVVENNAVYIEKEILRNFIITLHNKHAPRTVKRKIASLKAFSKYLEESEYIEQDLFYKINTKFREPKILPKTIEIHTLETFITTLYKKHKTAKSTFAKEGAIRNIAIIELLIGTGLRISELCTIKKTNIDLQSGIIRIYGKGAKERILPISNATLLSALKQYENTTSKNNTTEFFFINSKGQRISEQSVRFMIKKIAKESNIDQNITPHMFRHSFATMLLEQDVDIRYIQKMLGHSSISITEIYTYVSSAKQRDILLHKNPRNCIRV